MEYNTLSQTRLNITAGNWHKASEENFKVEVHFKLTDFYKEIVMLLLKDIKKILKGKRKPYWMLVVKEILTFDNRVYLIDQFMEIILKLIVEIQDILGGT